MIAAFCVVAAAEEPAPPALEGPDLPPWGEALRDQLARGGRPDEEARAAATAMVRFEDAVGWQTGAVSVGDGAVALALGPGDRYAPPADASRILEAWGNPPDPDTLGLWLPEGAHLFGDGSWAVLITLQRDGWVDDADASSLDYGELLGSMQAAERESAAARRSAGLEGLELVGWAEPPRYDPGPRVLYWATTIRADSGHETLNYDVRVLGRRGVLSLNALSSVDQLPQVKGEMERIRTAATFTEGHRYTDYLPGVDEKAAYGLAALVAGGAVAAKTGLFKGLLALLLASKKLIVAAGAAALAGGGRLWASLTGRKRDAER